MHDAAFHDWLIWSAEALLFSPFYFTKTGERKSTRAYLCLLLVFAACSEDVVSTDEIPDIDGTWQGELTQIEDQCGLGIDPLLETHQVRIDGSAVTLTTGDGRTLEGSTTSDTSFSVEISDGQAFPTIDRVEYSSITSGTAEVRISHIWSRPGGCLTTWGGTMQLSVPQ